MQPDTMLVNSSAPDSNSGSTTPSGSALIDVLALLARRRRFLLTVTAVGGVISLVIALCLTPLYTATAVIMPPPKAQSLASAMMGQLGSMAGSLSPALGLKDPADLQIGILRSRTVNQSLIRRFDLQRVYAAKTQTDALKKLASRATFASGKDSLIHISVEDADPKRAADLANGYVSELHVQNSRLALTESGQRRLLFEQLLQEERQTLASAEERLKQTQVSTGALQVTSQADGVVRLITQLRTEIAGREVLLQRLRIGATNQNPEVSRQEAELTSLRSQLAKVETGNGHRTPGDPIIPFANVPQAGLESLRALREVKYHESLFEVLAKQYEAARIDDAKESQAVQVVDAAVPPERKSWPPRALLVALGSLTSALVTLFYILIAYALKCAIGPSPRPSSGSANSSLA